MMAHTHFGIEQDLVASPIRSNTEAQFGLFTAERGRTDAADLGSESSDLLQDRPTHRHVAPEGVTHCGKARRLTYVATANNPIELLRHPGGTILRPYRVRVSTDTGNSAIFVVVHQSLCPPWLGISIVIEESDHIA